MSVTTRTESLAPDFSEVDPQLVEEIEALEQDTPQTNFFRDIDSLTRANIPLAIVNKAIHAYFHDIDAMPTEEQAAWWKLYFTEVLPQESEDGESIRWVGRVAAWMRTGDNRFRNLHHTELNEAVYARRDITEALDAQKRAQQGLPPREPAWDSAPAEPWLARKQ